MCQIMEDFGKEERHDEKIETALRMLDMGMDLISKISGLTMEEVKALSESKSA